MAEREESFAGIAALYQEHRAGYPDAVVEAILEGLAPPVRVADVGCGTGIASRLLAAHGAAVVGIEPDADMIEQARRARGARGAEPEYREGSGECTGLPDGGVDVVLCAQSYQWLDPRRALPEFHRILRRGGRLALLWNDKSDRDPFTAAFSRVLKEAQATARREGTWHARNTSRDPTVSGLFENLRRGSFPNPQVLDHEGVLGRARSASFYPKAGAVREHLDEKLRALFERHARGGRVTLWHQAELTLADRRERHGLAGQAASTS